MTLLLIAIVWAAAVAFIVCFIAKTSKPAIEETELIDEPKLHSI